MTGIASDGKSFDIAVLRYKSNGLLDTTFDGDGIVVTALKGADFGLSLALQADGKIVVSGKPAIRSQNQEWHSCAT